MGELVGGIFTGCQLSQSLDATAMERLDLGPGDSGNKLQVIGLAPFVLAELRVFADVAVARGVTDQLANIFDSLRILIDKAKYLS
jgi:hypothetical protein